MPEGALVPVSPDRRPAAQWPVNSNNRSASTVPSSSIHLTIKVRGGRKQQKKEERENISCRKVSERVVQGWPVRHAPFQEKPTAAQR